MSNILAANKKVNESCDEVMKLFVKSMEFDLGSLRNMDEDTFKVLQASLRLTDAVMELQTETARVLNNIDRKLNEVEDIVSRLEIKVH